MENCRDKVWGCRYVMSLVKIICGGGKINVGICYLVCIGFVLYFLFFGDLYCCRVIDVCCVDLWVLKVVVLLFLDLVELVCVFVGFILF